MVHPGQGSRRPGSVVFSVLVRLKTTAGPLTIVCVDKNGVQISMLPVMTRLEAPCSPHADS